MAAGPEPSEEIQSQQTTAKQTSDSKSSHATQQSNGEAVNGTAHDQDELNDDSAEPPQGPDNVFQLTVKLPHAPGKTKIMVSTQEQVQDIRQSIVDTPHTFQYSCFHLEHKGKRVNDFIELSEVADIISDPVCTLVEDPYTEAQARMHFVRVRELIGAAGNRTDLVVGIDAGLSLCDGIEISAGSEDPKNQTSPVADYDLSAAAPISTLLAKQRPAPPKTIKTLSISPWNPPPHNLRMRGHLLYLQATTSEGEQYYITSHVSGFYVNKSTNSRFDPAPRSTPKSFAAHSLITLLSQISPSFDASFTRLQEYNGQRDPLASYTISNSFPVAPWLVASTSANTHQADLTRSQEAFLLSGAENPETLRDWNEEFQSTRELPKETVQDRVFRERLTSKIFAEYNEAAVRGACLVARGELQPLNPTEARDAQIFVYNNVFYSFGADGVGTFASDGGDAAARVAVGKDVQGVRAVNQLDVNGLFTPGTVVVDYLGKRIVAQSIVPGIFKQRDPGEHQIDYGGVEGKDIIATHEGFVKPFAELSKHMRVKQHLVWDKENKKHELEASVETKGLLGTDGRKYVLDLYRISPLDILWLEKHRSGDETDADRYPHRMTVLRPELVDAYRVVKLRAYISKEIEARREAKKNSEKTIENGETATNGENASTEPQQEAVDVSGFSFTLNPDVFSGQRPQTDEERQQYQQDEADVRAVCQYLREEVLPRMLRDLQEGDAGFPMDGVSLSTLLHKRGVNIRYLGEITDMCAAKDDKRLQALQQLCVQEMVSRVFKHFVNKQLANIPACFAQSALSHLLNCLLGAGLNERPQAEVEEELRSAYPDADLAFTKITPASMKEDLTRQVFLRYRYKLQDDLVQTGKELQMLREVSLKLGLQLEAKDYNFSRVSPAPAAALREKQSTDSLSVPHTNGTQAEGGKKKKKKNADHSPNRAASASPVGPPSTFSPENVYNIMPVIKEASPRSVLAEEALDAGRVSLQQDQKELGQELLLESLSLHEQIYGILHPEVARVYHALSTLYYSLDEKSAAVELARKAVIVSERTLGVDSTETILAYLNLSLFEHATGNTRTALALVCHALNLWKLVYGIKHPDSMTTINNAAVMLQTLKQFHDSRIWFEASLSICEEVTGKSSINTATLLFQLAQALALDHDSKQAVAKMRESYTIFKNELGAENQNTKEAETWLETLTHSAVNQAKQANAMLQRRLLMRDNARGGARVGLTGRTTQPLPATPSVDALQTSSATGRTDQRSLDELLKYINGEGGSTPKKGRTNPKRRQQKAS
ncbi:hypothetical protein AMS68_001458 [Peltaster fructicola]|uniref:Clustered mitochondria protein homolog n=1 Tax=Peltaster fructicola TaxID=286661 RepID=A0A6H0XMS3_9PEZI|nr:hypothetical protein AMS68_001458 [Peltaster fructicola]